MNLNHYLAAGGIASRRKAVELITAGSVTVNSTVVIDPAYEVAPEDKVYYRTRLVVPQQFVYIMLNKPAGVVTSASDDRGRTTVLDLLGAKARSMRLFPVGRLDYDTEGLLLLTNDGDLTQILTHPKYQVKKKYKVVLDRPLTVTDQERLMKGIILRDGFIAADKITVGKYNRTVAEVSLHSGRNRIVRRMFAQLRYHVQSLERIGFASLVVKGLARGGWRVLTKDELERLKKLRTRATVTTPAAKKSGPRKKVVSKKKAIASKGPQAR